MKRTAYPVGDFEVLLSWDLNAKLVEYNGIGEDVTVPYYLTDKIRITKLGDELFYEKNLRSVKVEFGINDIGDDVFSRCERLEAVDIPISVESIGSGAFAWCGNLKKIHLPFGLRRISDETFFFCDLLRTIEIPEEVEAIGNRAFAFCSSLRELHIPANVRYIGKRIVDSCSELERITVDQENTRYEIIEGGLVDTWEKQLIAFPYCIRRNTVIIADDRIEKIDEAVFAGNRSVEQVILEGIKSICCEAFAGCEYLEYIYLPFSLQEIGEDAFQGCQNLTIVVKEGSFAERYAKEKGLKYILEDG